MVEPIGRRIARLRKQRGWSTSELGERVGRSKRMVEMWEAEKGEPNAEALALLVITLGPAVLPDPLYDILARLEAKLDGVLGRLPDEGEVTAYVTDAALLRADISALRKTLREQGVDVGEQSS